MTGVQAFLEVLAAGGVTHVFGNPGTTELPLSDALAGDDRFRYVLGLQEVPVVAMADGYASASGGVGVVNVHICCGLGNAMGMLYNAYRAGTPLLLTAGQQDRRLRLGEPVLAGDMVSVARPWTKWAVEAGRVEDIPAATRRAVQAALTPPTGPVFLALPIDVQLETCAGADLAAPSVPDRHIRPPREALQRAACVLGEARNPAILAGSRVTEAAAMAELASVAERLGALVLAEQGTAHGRIPLAPTHPLYAGPMPLWAPEVRKRLSEFDVLLVAGANLLCDYIYLEPARPVPAGLRLVQMDIDPWQVGKNYPVEVGMVGDLKAGLAELDGLLAEAVIGPRAEAVRARGERHAAAVRAERETLRAKADAEWDRRPMAPMTLMGALARAVPPDVAVVEEAATTTAVLERLGVPADPAGFFGHRGWALGWGVGCALGVKLAWPGRPVLAVVGDGAALYGIQGLWTAAHEGIPVTFIICNNAQYQILKHCGDVLPLPHMAARRYVGMDLVQPEIDFVALARSLGVEAHRISAPDELTERVRCSLTGDRPQLFDVPITR